VNEALLPGHTLTESDLLRALATMRATTPEEATGAAVELAAARLGVPVAGWVVKDDPSRLKLAAVRGFSPEGADAVLDGMTTIRRMDLGSNAGLRQLARGFADIAGTEEALWIEAAPALLLVATGAEEAGTTPDLVRSILQTSMERLAAVMTAQRRNDQLDLAVAWTAHEVKSPLLGAMAALERARMSPDGDVSEALDRAHRELEQLAGLVDDLLSWAVLDEPIRPEPADLVSVVREAIEACELDGGADRVRLLAPSSIRLSAAPSHLRGALANVIRNALLYSPRETVVKVSAASRDGVAWVTVRDEGIGIPEEERQWVFDPFTRGVGAPRGGKGLGLFVTRRVVEAHQGEIWIDPSKEGTTFRIRLPLRPQTEDGGSA
jgi:signal transduction histidine kinase